MMGLCEFYDIINKVIWDYSFIYKHRIYIQLDRSWMPLIANILDPNPSNLKTPQNPFRNLSHRSPIISLALGLNKQ